MRPSAAGPRGGWRSYRVSCSACWWCGVLQGGEDGELLAVALPAEFAVVAEPYAFSTALMSRSVCSGFCVGAAEGRPTSAASRRRCARPCAGSRRGRRPGGRRGRAHRRPAQSERIHHDRVESSAGDHALFHQVDRLTAERVLEAVADEAGDLLALDDRRAADRGVEVHRGLVTASSEVRLPGTTSTSGTRCGGLNGWPIRMRAGVVEPVGEGGGRDRRGGAQQECVGGGFTDQGGEQLLLELGVLRSVLLDHVRVPDGLGDARRPGGPGRRGRSMSRPRPGQLRGGFGQCRVDGFGEVGARVGDPDPSVRARRTGPSRRARWCPAPITAAVGWVLLMADASFRARVSASR